MDWKKILVRLAILFPVAFLGGTLFAVVINAFVYFRLIPDEALAMGGYGSPLVRYASYVWMGAIALALASLGLKEKWRYVLYLAPLYAPSVYAIFYLITHR